MRKTPLNIAILGTRGIPAAYGGFETFAEELGVRLVMKGHQVTVYGRRGYFEREKGPQNYRGVAILKAPTIRQKYLETPLHALSSFIMVLFRRHQILLVCNAANLPFAWIAKLQAAPLFVNLDGIERRRSKWNLWGKLWYLLGEICSALFGNVLIADAKVIRNYYRKRYGVECNVLAYGGDLLHISAGEMLQKFNLEPKRYLLYVSRLEPENNALGLIQAFTKIDSPFPLVIVGDAPYAKDYIAALKSAANEKVIFTGYQFGASYQEFQSNAYLYIQATEVGGTHPALVESMNYGNCIVANATPENLEVLGGAGVFYQRNDFADLSSKLQYLLANPEKVKEFGVEAKKRAERYTWDRITEQYERLFMGELC